MTHSTIPKKLRFQTIWYFDTDLSVDEVDLLSKILNKNATKYIRGNVNLPIQIEMNGEIYYAEPIISLLRGWRWNRDNLYRFLNNDEYGLISKLFITNPHILRKCLKSHYKYIRREVFRRYALRFLNRNRRIYDHDLSNLLRVRSATFNKGLKEMFRGDITHPTDESSGDIVEDIDKTSIMQVPWIGDDMFIGGNNGEV